MTNILSVSIILAIGLSSISAVPNCPSTNEEMATLLPHESDCSKFYKCETGVAIVYDCPATLYFNPVLKVCDYPEEAGCGGTGSGSSTTEGSTDGGSGGSTDGGSGGNTDGGVTGGPDGPKCPAEDGDLVTLFPHQDCTKFWKCDRGIAYEKDCPAGLQFNPTLLVCDYPENAGCDGTGIGGGTTPGDGSGGSTDGGSGGNTDGGVTGGPGGPECPAEDGEFATLFPHQDCTKFWKCDRGIAYEKDCPAGLQFNPILLVCDYPEDAGCDGTGIGGGTTPSSTTPGGGSGGSTDGGSGGSTGGSGTAAPGAPECPAEDGEFVTLFPHQDCTKFWKCDRGIAYEKDCPAGLQFNPTLLVCDYPENAGCDGTGNGGGTTPSSTTPGGGSGGSTDGGSGGSTGGGGTAAPGAPECPAEDGEFVTLFPHQDCTKFWKCDRGIAYEKDCPAGLQFNPTLLVCDYPEDAGCDGTGIGGGTTPSSTTPGGGSGGSTDGGSGGSTGGGGTAAPGAPECPAEDGEFVTLFPHQDCTKFWKCDRGIAYEKDCPAGLQFNPTLLVCDYPENAGCDGTGNGGGTTPSSTTPGGGSGGSTDGGSDGSTGGGGTAAPGAPECPAEDGEFVTLFPHQDCTKFWKCDRGIAYEKDCPAGLQFNPTLLVCDYPESAGCDGTGNGGGTTPSSTTPGGGSGGSTDGGSGGSTGGGGTAAPGAPECPAEDGEFVTLFPHQDCTKFWKCDRGIAYEKDCPAGLQFNPTLLVCDYPEDAGCDGTGIGGGTTPSSTTPGGGSGGSTDGGSGGSTGGGGTAAPGAPECPAEDGEFVTLFPHQDCTKFWKCDRGIAYEKDCPAGLQFNPTLLVCDYPEDAGCDGTGIGGGTTPSSTTPGGGSGGSTDGGSGGSTGGGGTAAPGAPECPAEDGEFVTLFPHQDCTKFWKCDRGIAYEKDCPAGLQFNPTLLVCDYPEDAGCDGTGIGGGTTPSSTTPGGGSGGSTDGGSGGSTGGGGTAAPGAPECPAEDGEFVTLFPHQDCTKFWKCDRGIAYEKDCPAGLQFNPTLLVCDYPEDAGCDGTGIGGGTTPSSTTPGGGSGGSTDGGSGGSTDGNTSGPGTGGPQCPAEDGDLVTLFPHEDCTKFWKCDRGIAYVIDCPAGLHFNPTLSVCDYPEDAGCDGTGIGGGGSTQSTTQSTTQGTTPSTTQSTTQGSTQGTTTSKPGGDGFCQALSCPELNGEWVYFVPIPSDCRRFCKCDWGTPYEFTCPANLFFDPVLDVCDYQENVACAM